jgi:hypothetical protein
MNIRLLRSFFILFIAIAAATGATAAALLSNPASATSVTYSTASADLLIAPNIAGNNPGVYGSSISGDVFTGLAPGDSRSFSFWLKNSGTGTFDLDLFADLNNITYKDSADVALTESQTDLDTTMSVSFTCNVSNSTTRDGSTPAKTLTAWQADEPHTLSNGGHIDSGALEPDNGTSNGTGRDEARCTMTTTVNPSSTAKETSAVFDVSFTGQQVID